MAFRETQVLACAALTFRMLDTRTNQICVHIPNIIIVILYMKRLPWSRKLSRRYIVSKGAIRWCKRMGAGWDEDASEVACCSAMTFHWHRYKDARPLSAAC